jgi:hypothetical protein
VVGDRLDTDIEGAVRAGMDSLLVLTGVSGPAELFAAPAQRRPTYVAPDLSGLFAAGEAVRVPKDGDATATDGWRVSRAAAGMVLDGAGEPVAALRALCAVAWAGGAAAVAAGSDPARAALAELGLD